MSGETKRLDRSALFADETDTYRKPDIPCSGEDVVIRFRTAREDADAVFYGERGNPRQIRMEKAWSDVTFDYYQSVFKMGENPRYYWFRIVKREETCWYNRLGAVDEPQGQDAFCIIPQNYISAEMEAFLQKGQEEGRFRFFYKLDERHLGWMEDVLKAREERQFYVEEDSRIEEGAVIGGGTRIGHFCHIRKGVRIGRDCIVGNQVNIAENVIIGNQVRIGNNVTICQGVELGDEVICGHSCVFAEELFPKAREGKAKRTLVRHGASIGSNATIVSGVTIGEHGMAAAGAVVTESIPAFDMAMGIYQLK